MSESEHDRQPDPGHLLPDEAWQAVVAEARRQAQRIAAGELPVESLFVGAQQDDLDDDEDEYRREVSPLRLADPLTMGLPLALDGAVYAPSNGGQRGGAPTFGVLHSAETPLEPGFAAAIARYFAGGTGTSCHYMTDPAESWGVLPDERIAWHCGNGNTNSLAIEQAGRASFTRAQWLSEAGWAQMRRNAVIMRGARDRYGIGCYWMTDAQLADAHRRRIVGGWATHDQCRRVLGGTSHTDPMPNFPLTEQMQLANTEGDDMPLNATDLAAIRKIVREEVPNALIPPSPELGIGGKEARSLKAMIGRLLDDASSARTAAERAADGSAPTS